MSIVNRIKGRWLPQGIRGQSEKEQQETIGKSAKIHNKKWIGLVVLGTAILILCLLSFYFFSGLSRTAFWGLGIMVGTLVIGMCVEVAMIKKRRFPKDGAVTQYKRKLICYYKARRTMIFIVSPLLLAGYIYGFVMLLSIFEQGLLGEFYVYLICLFWAVFLGLIVLTGVELKKELEILESLIADDRL